MTSVRFGLRAVLPLFMAFAAWGCADGETEYVDQPAVSIAGVSGVEVGGTTQLTASTVGATETYTWSSSIEGIAAVSANGLVTANGVGETVITAKGDTSGLSGTHNIVVYSSVVVSDVPVIDPDAGPTDVPPTDVPPTDVPPTDVPPTDVPPTDSGPTVEVPHFAAWSASGHARASAEAFRHWDEEDPAEVPASCAKCHSSGGFSDFIGADGSAVGSVEAPVPVGSVIDCAACHSDAANALDTVTFPSGAVLNGVGPEARCMTCHQGRSSKDTVDQSIADAMIVDDDTPDEDLHFLNIHYYAAGATLNAGRVRGGYEYADSVYDWRFRHVPGLDTCVGCHDPHSLEVRVDVCKDCHTGVTDKEDLKDIRMIASSVSDYDGDGDLAEGMYYELQGLRDRLLTTIQAYVTAKSLSAICYDAHAYPYWFKDTDGDGACSEDEASYGNRYVEWTASLLRATYNFQVALKDPGAFAHNSKYIIQLLHDSVNDLNGRLAVPEDLSALKRNDPGHFDGAAEAARHWDEDEDVSASCSKCHGGSEGLRFYLDYGVGKTVQEQDNGLDCATCHSSFGTEFAVLEVSDVDFPSGVTSAVGTVPSSNLCATCHVGRESAATIDARIASGSLGFRNVHYLPAASVKMGADAAVGYQYDGKTYAGEWATHVGGHDCTSCHSPLNTKHSFDVNDNFDACKTCHTTATALDDIRGVARTADYDFDGDAAEPLDGEIEGLAEDLMAQIQVAASAGGADLCYDAHAYPYFFVDTDGNGMCDGAAEANYGNSYKDWTAALMRATHNYQISQKEPGAWAHNFNYMAQLLIDAIEDLGGDVSNYTRP